MSQEQMWNERYRSSDDYLFGTEPNHFIEARSHLFETGHTALCIADGEGRNSVWLAQRGLDVTAVDISPIAVEKARRLAAQRNVNVRYEIADLLSDDLTLSLEPVDWLVAIFVQFAGPNERPRLFQRMQQLTRPGGRIVLQGYTPRQLDYRTGGPSAVENLYTTELLEQTFAGWHIEELVEYEAVIAEGSGHVGHSALIGMVARKPLA